jgi:hypothetical protein
MKGWWAGSPTRRAILLLVCIALGCLVGYAGQYLAGSEWWYLAVPVILAAGWLAVADPEQCMPQPGHGSKSAKH